MAACALIRPMRKDYKTIALVGRYQTPEVADGLARLAAFLEARGVNVLIEAETADHTGSLGLFVASYEEIGATADCVVVLGGDGTVLNVARQLAPYGVPLVGVNQGRLGFMTDIARSELLERMAELLEGKFQVERRLLLHAEVRRAGRRQVKTVALNDVVLDKGGDGRMIEFDLHLDGEFIYRQRSDGLVVSTPTGSTAYALSANGPILHPQVRGIALVPLCPHALTHRPVTISDQSEIALTLTHAHDARVHFDGQAAFSLQVGDVIRLRRSHHAIIFLHPPGYSYYAMLREKLHWGAAPNWQ